MKSWRSIAHQILGHLIDELRAALDAEPEASPSDEERARKIIQDWYGDEALVKDIAAALAEARRESEQLREAVRKGLLTVHELRAALDAEPEASPSDEERAKKAYGYALDVVIQPDTIPSDEERAPPAAELVMPVDFQEWAKGLHPVFRRSLSIHNLRGLWEDRNAALTEARREERERCARECEIRVSTRGYELGFRRWKDETPMETKAGEASACANAIRALDDK